MKNEVTEKLELFLQNLRCEDTKRETLVHLDSCQEESERLVGSNFQIRSGTVYGTDAVEILCKTAGGISAGDAGCLSDIMRPGHVVHQR